MVNYMSSVIYRKTQPTLRESFAVFASVVVAILEIIVMILACMYVNVYSAYCHQPNYCSDDLISNYTMHFDVQHREKAALDMRKNCQRIYHLLTLLTLSGITILVVYVVTETYFIRLMLLTVKWFIVAALCIHGIIVIICYSVLNRQHEIVASSEAEARLLQFPLIYPTFGNMAVDAGFCLISLGYVLFSIIVLRRCHSYMVLEQLYEERWKQAMRSKHRINSLTEHCAQKSMADVILESMQKLEPTYHC